MTIDRTTHKSHLQIKQYQSCEPQACRITLLHTEKFKTITLAWYYERTLDSLTAVYALAVRLMVRAFGDKDPMGVNQRLQGLYGAYLQADAVKYGQVQSLQLKLTFVNDLHLPHAINSEAMACFLEMFSKPVTGFAGFEQLVALEKSNLLAAIAQRDQDRGAKAYDTLLEGLFPETSFARTPYGRAEEVKAITPAQVSSAIETMISARPVEYMAVGEDIEDQVLGHFSCACGCEATPLKFEAKDLQTQARSQVPSPLQSGPKIWSDTGDVEQTKLALAYTFEGQLEAADQYAAMLLGHLLGGGPSSVLFQDLREARGLCYAIHARVDKFLGLMTIHAGLASDKIEETRAAVDDHLEQIKAGHLTKSALALSKKMLVASYLSLADSPVGLMNFERSQYLAGLPEPLEAVIDLVEAVDREDIARVAKGIKMIGCYTLAPKEKL